MTSERRFGDIGVEVAGPQQRVVMYVNDRAVLLIVTDFRADAWQPGQIVWPMTNTQWVDLVSTEVVDD